MRHYLLMLTVLVLSACNPSKNTTSTNPKIERFGGMMLYSVRDDMAKDPKATLQQIADMGYRYIEAAGYQNGNFYGMSPTDFKNYVESLGLTPISSHHGDVTYDNLNEMIAADKKAGFKYFVVPIPPMGHFKFDAATMTMSMSEDLEFVTEFLNTAGKKCSEAGLQLLYHNHNFEFKPNANGIVPMDYFLENTDPKYVNFQLDLFWAANAEAEPTAYFEKYPQRFKVWHVKDMDAQGRFAPVGTGKIDFAKILQSKDAAGMEFYFVEQDVTFDGMKPLEAAQISHNNLKKLGFD